MQSSLELLEASLGKTLLASALLHSVHQGQICLLPQVFLAYLLAFKLEAPGPTNRFFFLSLTLFYWIPKFMLLKDIEPMSMYLWASLVAERLKCLPAMQWMLVLSLGWEDPLAKEMATHSNILAWRIPWTEEPGGLQSTGSQRVDTTE